MRVIRTIPSIGRIQLMGKTLVCQFNKSRYRDLFGCPTWEFTDYSDINLLEHEMRIAVSGRYTRFQTYKFQVIVQSVPEVLAGIC
jgi:UDP-N-acetylglucosamine transferase subunit ALG13